MPNPPNRHMHRVGGGDGRGNTDINSAYWKAFVMALQTRIGGAGNDRLFYAAAETNRSIPASEYIPMATTNEFLYNEADALIPLDEPVVTLTDTHDHDKADKLRKEMTDAIAELRVAKSAALKAYNEDVKNGITAKGQGFPKWCEQNDPSIKALEETMRTKSALFDACQNGDGVASNLNTFRNRVNDAALGAGQNPGICMQCCPEPIGDIAAKIHTPPGQPKPPIAQEPDVSASYWRAAYVLDPTYRGTMDRWSSNFEKSSAHNSINLDIQSAMNKSWKDLGYEQVAAGFDASCAGFIRVGASGMETSKYESAGIEHHQTGVSMSMFWKEMQLFNVKRGTWDVPNVRQTFALPAGHAGTGLGKRAVPTQFLCASGFGLKCVLQGEAKKAFNEAWERQVASKGAASVRICCFGFDACAKYDKKDEQESSTWEYDAASGTITINPTPTFGNAVLLGICCSVVEL
ncbi:hypothetical protein PCL_09799 [Purpureocillium lilacinum]|uniref:Uncharacterized protein n=1 Tax=Purpureocillium lilacinum TaxID=33203 RepID=A0A2U3EE38_PURLI|nr:hypothetical protein Purlil1_1178 [Purpureocillium lilacinum]PWI72784.1 hypothetical protein PCL_09799 [Purpureocillium lilacinum]